MPLYQLIFPFTEAQLLVEKQETDVALKVVAVAVALLQSVGVRIMDNFAQNVDA